MTRNLIKKYLYFKKNDFSMIKVSLSIYCIYIFIMCLITMTFNTVCLNIKLTKKYDVVD